MKKIKYEELKSFQRQYKKLRKKFPTLDDDIEVAKKNAIEVFHLQDIDNYSIKVMSKIPGKNLSICKLRKFACKSLKGRGSMSGIRLIYAFHTVTLTVTLIEIYYKQDQATEDQELIKAWIRSFILD